MLGEPGARAVGAYELKTHLSRLLDQVSAGEEITITKHGRAVARLVPAEDARPSIAEAVAALRAARIPAGLGMSVRDAIDEGRR